MKLNLPNRQRLLVILAGAGVLLLMFIGYNPLSEMTTNYSRMHLSSSAAKPGAGATTQTAMVEQP